MTRKIATIQEDKTGDVYTGAVVEKPSLTLGDVAVGLVCPPYLGAALVEALSPPTSTAVVVNGESHTGRKV